MDTPLALTHFNVAIDKLPLEEVCVILPGIADRYHGRNECKKNEALHVDVL